MQWANFIFDLTAGAHLRAIADQLKELPGIGEVILSDGMNLNQELVKQSGASGIGSMRQ
jgi:hypothetical protein